MRRDIPIWFFIGVSLTGNGALVLGAGIVEWRHPAPTTVALAGLHAGVWWGALLLGVGLMYCLRYAPWRRP